VGSWRRIAWASAVRSARTWLPLVPGTRCRQDHRAITMGDRLRPDRREDPSTVHAIPSAPAQERPLSCQAVLGAGRWGRPRAPRPTDARSRPVHGASPRSSRQMVPRSSQAARASCTWLSPAARRQAVSPVSSTSTRWVQPGHGSPVGRLRTRTARSSIEAPRWSWRRTHRPRRPPGEPAHLGHRQLPLDTQQVQGDRSRGDHRGPARWPRRRGDRLPALPQLLARCRH